MSMFNFSNQNNQDKTNYNETNMNMNIENAPNNMMNSTTNNNMISSNTNMNTKSNNSTAKKGILSRLKGKKEKEEESAMIQKNIDNSLKVNVNEMIDPLEMGIKNSLFFRLHVSGLIESANFYEGDAVFCRYDIVYGTDWEKEDGQVAGQSQFACKGEGTFDYFVWNMPFECSFRSLNPTGWPQLVLSCSYPDFLGREVIKGYGVVHIPTQPGRHERTVQIFSPLTSSSLLKVLGFLVGTRAEIINAPKVVASGEGREITRTKSEGSVKVVFQVTLRDTEKFGYNI